MKTPLRIRILGGSGSGKTTFALQLGKQLSLPVLHIDDIFWLKGWKQKEVDELREDVRAFMSKHDKWIIEGNYSTIKDVTFDDATHVIIKYPHLPINLWRLFWREVVRRSPYKFLPVTPPPKNTIHDKNDEDFITAIRLLMTHTTRYYKSRARKWIREIKEFNPNLKIYIKR